MTATDPQLPIAARSAARAPSGFAAVGIAALFFAAMALSATWLEFSNGSENLNVATALEIRRTGRCLLPTLNDELRIKKPPLTAWTTAAAIDPATVTALNSPVAADRHEAYRRLAWQTRWPSLLAAAAMLLAVFELGRRAGGFPLAWTSAVLCGSSMMFLRHGQYATTDVHLALWVVVANACFAAALLSGWCWTGFAGAGLAMGLAFMSKGPVAIVQTAAPAIVYALWRLVMDRPPLAPALRRWIGPTLLSIACFLLVGAPWYIGVAIRHPEVWREWYVEVTREGATNLPPGKWYNYFLIVPWSMPWAIFLIGGLWLAIPAVAERNPEERRSARPLVLMLFMLAVPIVIMSFFRDRKERYLLPMVAPAAVLAARAVLEVWANWVKDRKQADKGILAIHWSVIAVIAIGLPIVGAVLLKTIDGRPWYRPATAAILSLIGAGIVAIGLGIARRRLAGLVWSAVAVMLFSQIVLRVAYRDSEEGRSEMRPLAERILAAHPDAEVYFSHLEARQSPADLSIYLNRAVPYTPSAGTMTPGLHPRIIVVRERKGRLEGPIPPGATLLQKILRDNDWWHAYVLPPAQAGT